ncbi:MAG: hypothetical protein HQL51_16465, partial [Magnetococcales bacterium]|nr:hypothetical protein [Magnetococcales bacterium]
GRMAGGSVQLQAAGEFYGTADARINRGMLRLLMGDLKEGFADYRWRWRTPHLVPRPFRQPEWDPARDPPGLSVLVHAEQGLGDVLQFIRYLPLLVARGDRVTLEVQAALADFLAPFGATHHLRVVANGDPLPITDRQIPLLCLPRVFHTTLESLPDGVPYLFADPERIARWRERLGEGFTVGMVRAGNPSHRNDRNRSLDPALLGPILAIPGARFFTLQKDPRPGDREKMAAFSLWSEVIDVGPELTDFHELAAALAALDLLISVDTAPLHLAGAMGRPAWALLNHPPDWRWLLQRDDSPWYPSLRLFRQSRAGAWEEPIQAAAEALRRRVLEGEGAV